jgi:hypothetical protein
MLNQTFFKTNRT